MQTASGPCPGNAACPLPCTEKAPSGIRAFIFDLDGVLVSTDEYHYQAWKHLAQQEGLSFSREVNRLQRGVSRMESLDILLDHAGARRTDSQKQRMAEEKNNDYLSLLKNLRPDDRLPGVAAFLAGLRTLGIRMAVGSSSKNTRTILHGAGLEDAFDAVADGTMITRSKPDPEVFLLAAKLLDLPPAVCVVVEDADAGVEAAMRAGMRVVAVGAAQQNPSATLGVESLAAVTAQEAIRLLVETEDPA